MARVNPCKVLLLMAFTKSPNSALSPTAVVRREAEIARSEHRGAGNVHAIGRLQSGARVETAVDLAQTLSVQMGVNFGGADAGVAEEFLDDAQVRAVFEEVGGKAVAQHVRGDVPPEARPRGAALDPLPEGHGGEGSAAPGEE
jgi:hypothetical protein